jgi:hypothetical protein
MSPSLRRTLIAGAAVLVVAGSYTVRIRGGMADFAVNYRAGQRLEAGETLYQTADGHYMFKYLPASALVYLPLGHLPIEVAKATWFAISLLALIWSFALVRQLVPRPHRRYLLPLTALVLAKYFLHELRLGQINVLVTLVMLLATRALSEGPEPRNELAAGLLAGIATALKPYAALLFPYLLVRRWWFAGLTGITTLAIALLVPTMFYGVQGNLQVLHDWAMTLSQSTPALLTNNDNVSVMAFFAKWFRGDPRAIVPSIIVLSLLAVLMLTVVVGGRGRSGRTVLECAMLLTLIPLVSPLGWDYTFLMSLLAVALVVNAFEEFSRGAQAVLAVNFSVIALALFDLLGRRAYGIYMQWSVTTVNFLIIVIALAYLRFRTHL